MKVLLIYLITVNCLAFILYGVDKHRARSHAWRIPERTLIAIAAAGGSIGAIAGMRVFRHKTRHGSFRYGLPLILALQIAAVCILYWKLGR